MSHWRWEKCDGGKFGACNAYGKGKLGLSDNDCPQCEGTGKIRVKYNGDWGDVFKMIPGTVRCPYCRKNAGFKAATSSSHKSEFRDVCPHCGSWLSDADIEANAWTVYDKLSKNHRDSDKPADKFTKPTYRMIPWDPSKGLYGGYEKIE